MRRASVWTQLFIGWLPVWALYGTLILVMHQPVSPVTAAMSAFRAIVPAALLGLLVNRFIRGHPWPRPFRASFVALHVLAAAAYAVAWVIAVSIVESMLHFRLTIVVGPGFLPFFVLGVWLYVMIAGVSYSQEAAGRVVRAEAAASRAQLAALRSQLHPHFIFNALHTVVQLIPREPVRAAEAAEQVAQLLRTVAEEDRDMVELGEEWAFVRRYLDIERIRFGDRLEIRAQIADAALAATLPSFALQTLVENAVRHGAAPRIERTRIEIDAGVDGGNLVIRVADDGAGSTAAPANGAAGTGLTRLRERLAVLYGGAASLATGAPASGGFTATLTIPLAAESGIAQADA